MNTQHETEGPECTQFYTITSHQDFAWRHSRAWHEERYIQVLRTVLDIMRRHPHYIFQLETKLQQLDPFLKWAGEHDAHLIDELKLRLGEGRLEVVCALSNPRISEVYPETIIRNMAMGRAYFKNLAPEYEQKVYNAVDLMPGCSQMPQICRLAGYSYYMFTRPQGRQVVFNWVGLDGSTIISSRNGYGISHDRAGITPACARLYRPPVERVMLGGDDSIPDEALAREARAWDGRKKKISTVTAYFEAVEKYRDKLSDAGPVLDSLSVFSTAGLQGVHNLYFRNNQIEDLLLLCESLELMTSGVSVGYDGDKIEGLWVDLLENTGHALLHVFAEDFEERSDLITRTQKKAREYAACLLNRLAEHAQWDNSTGRAVIVANRLGWKRSDVVRLDVPEGNYQIKDQSGRVVPCEYGDENKVRFMAGEVPSVGYKTFYLCPADHPPQIPTWADGSNSIENECYRIATDEQGSLLILDKKTHRTLGDSAKGGIGAVVFRSAFPPEAENGWVMLGPFGDAQRCRWDHRTTRSCNGAVRCVLETSGTIGRTEVHRSVCLQPGSRRIDFGITIHARDKTDGVYRFAMPCDFEGELTAGIPFGAEVRKEYEKELFREEFFVTGYKNGTYASRWTDYSSDEYGYTFICPHGAYTGYELDPDTRTLEFTLLRARSTNSTAGGVGTDYMYGLGIHTFRCAVVPHEGDWRQAAAYRDALEFHNPLMSHVATKACEHTDALSSLQSFISVSPENVVLSSARMVREGAWELRLYETAGKPVTAVIETAHVPSEVNITDFSGKTVGDAQYVELKHHQIHVPVGAWKIVTLRVVIG